MVDTSFQNVEDESHCLPGGVQTHSQQRGRLQDIKEELDSLVCLFLYFIGKGGKRMQWILPPPKTVQ